MITHRYCKAIKIYPRIQSDHWQFYTWYEEVSAWRTSLDVGNFRHILACNRNLPTSRLLVDKRKFLDKIWAELSSCLGPPWCGEISAHSGLPTSQTGMDPKKYLDKCSVQKLPALHDVARLRHILACNRNLPTSRLLVDKRRFLDKLRAELSPCLGPPVVWRNIGIFWFAAMQISPHIGHWSGSVELSTQKYIWISPFSSTWRNIGTFWFVTMYVDISPHPAVVWIWGNLCTKGYIHFPIFVDMEKYRHTLVCNHICRYPPTSGTGLDLQKSHLPLMFPCVCRYFLISTVHSILDVDRYIYCLIHTSLLWKESLQFPKLLTVPNRDKNLGIHNSSILGHVAYGLSDPRNATITAFCSTWVHLHQCRVSFTVVGQKGCTTTASMAFGMKSIDHKQGLREKFRLPQHAIRL